MADVKKTAPVKSPKIGPQIRVVPGYRDEKKINIIQIFTVEEGKPETVIDQETISGSNLWFTKRAKRALAKMIKRQKLVAAFIASVTK